MIRLITNAVIAMCPFWPKNGMGAVEPPKCDPGVPRTGTRYAWAVPYTLATAQPVSSAQRWNDLV